VTCEDCVISRSREGCVNPVPAYIILCPRHAAVDALEEALKEAEWIQAEHGERKHCPVCKRWQGYSHAEFCPIAAALALAKPAQAVAGEEGK
jgi:hypothetical protein